ncbi:hypothetical protein TB2_041312 [Malus domestica]
MERHPVCEPDTPVEVPPNVELPICEPKPKVLGAKGLLLALQVCPNTDWDLNGLLDDCPKGLEEAYIFSYDVISKEEVGRKN